MRAFWQDLKFAVRMLRKNPGFTCVAVLTLALGVGANTTNFSVVHAVLLKPLPYPGAGRLVSLTASSFTKFTQIHDQTQTLESIAAYYSFGSSLLTVQEPEAIQSAHVSLDFFRVFDVAPARGRAFLPEEEQTGGANVAILWRASYRSIDFYSGGGSSRSFCIASVLRSRAPRYPGRSHHCPSLRIGVESEKCRAAVDVDGLAGDGAG